MGLLELKDTTIKFGGLVAVDSVNLRVNKGAIHALIGPNGAGKSTLFNLITGIYKPTSGNIHFEKKQIDGTPTFKLTSLGIARTFQNIRLFDDLTVADNVKIGTHVRTKQGLLGALTRFPTQNKEEKWITEKVKEELNFMKLYDKKDEFAKNLSYGDQRRLEIARALVSDPKIILLDEPAAGMNPQEKVTLMSLINLIRERGITVFLVEHDMKVVMGISDIVSVLDYGKKIAEGTPTEVKSNEDVIAAYLGAEYLKAHMN